MSKIAIIDDDASVRKSIALILGAQGHSTKLFDDPKNFLAAASITDFDLLIVDNNMPHMTGLELYEFLKTNNPEHPQFILMSGRLLEEEFPKYENSNKIQFLSKPFSISNLLNLIPK